MASSNEKLNSFEDNTKSWQDYSEYKKALWLSKNDTDCCFILTSQTDSSKVFNAHKWILKCASPKFELLFNDNVKEAHLDDSEPQAFKKFLDFIYYGDADNLIGADAVTLKHLISLGKTYQISSVVDICIGIMKQNLEKAENFDLIGIFEYACLIEDSELIDECKRVIVGRAASKIKFHDFNFNKPMEEKRHFIHVKKNLTSVTANNENSSPESCSNAFGGVNNATTATNLLQTNSLDEERAAFYKSPVPSFGLSSQTPKPLTFGLATNNFSSPQPLGTFMGKITPESNIFSTSAQNNIQTKNELSTLNGLSSQNATANKNSEEKIQNTGSNVKEISNENMFSNSLKPLGSSKGDITKCSYIYELNPSVFYEFQNTLNGHIPEYVRFNMIETYAKINGLIHNDAEKKIEGNNNNNNNDVNSKLTPEIQKQQLVIASTKQILNMMLRSIKFHRMTPKEFVAGPGKSILLDIAEKYDLLVGIVNKN